jgi:hypothetical protein
MTLELKHGDFELSELWGSLRSEIFYVMEDDSGTAVNEATAQVRHFHGRHWLYVDEIDGYALHDESEVEEFSLATGDDPRIRNVWDRNGKVIRDGVAVPT